MDVKVPELGESISEATVSKWLKKEGETVAIDEPLVELETDKVSVEVPSPIAGVVLSCLAGEGQDVAVGAVIARVDEGVSVGSTEQSSVGQVSSEQVSEASDSTSLSQSSQSSLSSASPISEVQSGSSSSVVKVGPDTSKFMQEQGVRPEDVVASGARGNIVKGDVMDVLSRGSVSSESSVSAVSSSPSAVASSVSVERKLDSRGEEVVRMSRLRQRIATRLKDAQNTAALLTTFNEIDMTNVMELRKKYKGDFEKKYGVRLGFMSFFVHATVNSLREFAAVNAEIHGGNIIYKNYYDIGIAVGSPMGLVVPVLRDADSMSIADVERNIADFGVKAREGKLSLAEMAGGSFTITNGGVFGSLLSTPIINPPQSGILGLHKIQKRPVVNDKNEIVIGEMMYVALSYDHRIVDGREAVSFLVRIKEMIEDPARLMMDI